MTKNRGFSIVFKSKFSMMVKMNRLRVRVENLLDVQKQSPMLLNNLTLILISNNTLAAVSIDRNESDYHDLILLINRDIYAYLLFYLIFDSI